LEGSLHASCKPEVTTAQVYYSHWKQPVDTVIKMIRLTKHICFPKKFLTKFLQLQVFKVTELSWDEHARSPSMPLQWLKQEMKGENS